MCMLLTGWHEAFRQIDLSMSYWTYDFGMYRSTLSALNRSSKPLFCTASITADNDPVAAITA